jgi:hypothetical protein
LSAIIKTMFGRSAAASWEARIEATIADDTRSGRERKFTTKIPKT